MNEAKEYRVNLDIYNGPLDLLLYLIRRDEVDIYDIPIARITEQYLRYVELLKALDPNLVGDFLVMAATLMEIKTRMLLPSPPPEEDAAEGVEIDPRAELVRQLLQYKAFKDAAGDLRESAERRALRFPRRPVRPNGDEDAPIDLENVQVWDLLDAFGRLMEAIGADRPDQKVIYDDTPIELHQADILDRLRREGTLTFRNVFAGRTDRVQILGLFLALLELVRLGKVLARQEQNFGEIYIQENPEPPEPPATEDEPSAEHDDAQPDDPAQPPADNADAAEPPAGAAAPAAASPQPGPTGPGEPRHDPRTEDPGPRP